MGSELPDARSRIARFLMDLSELADMTLYQQPAAQCCHTDARKQVIGGAGAQYRKAQRRQAFRWCFSAGHRLEHEAVQLQQFEVGEPVLAQAGQLRPHLRGSAIQRALGLTQILAEIGGWGEPLHGIFRAPWNADRPGSV